MQYLLPTELLLIIISLSLCRAVVKLSFSPLQLQLLAGRDEMQQQQHCHLSPRALTLFLPPIPLSLSLNPTWVPLRLTSGTEGDNHRAAPPVTWMYLSPDAWRPWQEVIRWPNDLPWWPFLSSCCSAERKDVVCCPQVPLSPTPLFSRTTETRWLIPGLSLLALASFCVSYISHPLSVFLFFHQLHPAFDYFLLPSSFMCLCEKWVNTLDTQKTTASPPPPFSLRLKGAKKSPNLCFNCAHSHMFMHVIVILLAIYLL